MEDKSFDYIDTSSFLSSFRNRPTADFRGITDGDSKNNVNIYNCPCQENERAIDIYNKQGQLKYIRWEE